MIRADGRYCSGNWRKITATENDDIIQQTCVKIYGGIGLNDDVLILAIESSCDETAAAVVKNGREVLSNIINSQIDIHTNYGGVVPEIASRKHIENIDGVIELALKKAEVTLDDITAIAVKAIGMADSFSSCLIVWIVFFLLSKRFGDFSR